MSLNLIRLSNGAARRGTMMMMMMKRTMWRRNGGAVVAMSSESLSSRKKASVDKYMREQDEAKIAKLVEEMRISQNKLADVICADTEAHEAMRRKEFQVRTTPSECSLFVTDVVIVLVIERACVCRILRICWLRTSCPSNNSTPS